MKVAAAVVAANIELISTKQIVPILHYQSEIYSLHTKKPSREIEECDTMMQWD